MLTGSSADMYLPRSLMKAPRSQQEKAP
jgi:hypothetical protein